MLIPALTAFTSCLFRTTRNHGPTSLQNLITTRCLMLLLLGQSIINALGGGGVGAKGSTRSPRKINVFSTEQPGLEPIRGAKPVKTRWLIWAGDSAAATVVQGCSRMEASSRASPLDRFWSGPWFHIALTSTLKQSQHAKAAWLKFINPKYHCSITVP